MSINGAQSIFKSYVPGAGWKAASKLTTGEKDLMKYRHINRIATHKKPGSEGASSKGRTIYGINTRGLGKKVSHHEDESFRETNVLGLSHPNGKGGGILRLNPGLRERGNEHMMHHTYVHEKQHLLPKRNPARLMERVNSSDRVRGREEGRADFLADQKAGKTEHRYPGSPEFRGGYEEVQRKMGSAKKRRVSKEYAWESLRREVAKMSPDPSSVHVMSSMTGKRRGKLKKVYRP